MDVCLCMILYLIQWKNLLFLFYLFSIVFVFFKPCHYVINISLFIYVLVCSSLSLSLCHSLHLPLLSITFSNNQWGFIYSKIYVTLHNIHIQTPYYYPSIVFYYMLCHWGGAILSSVEFSFFSLIFKRELKRNYFSESSITRTWFNKQLL